jgi:arylsulfatase
VYPVTGKSLLAQLNGKTTAQAHTDPFGDEG